MKKNEITFLPYVNQDYNAKHNRIDWVDPRAQRGGAVLGMISDSIHYRSLWATSMLVTDVKDEMCW